MPQQISDTYVDDAISRVRGAQDQDTTEELEKSVGMSSQEGERGFFGKLPRNIGLGLARASLNTIETVDDVFEAGAEMVLAPASGVTGARGARGAPIKVDKSEGIDPIKPLQTMFPGVFESAHNFLDEAEELNTISDDITQGLTQFIIPFTSYLKALGGIKNVPIIAKLGRLALAEGVTSASAFEAHEGRVADIVEIGRQMENKFGAVLNTVSPDGSLANTYIDWMTDRENESELGGRWKNAVDSLATTAGVVAVFKIIGQTLKASRRLIVNPERLEIPANTRFATPAEAESLEAAAKPSTSPMTRPAVAKRNPLGVEELDPALPTPNEARAEFFSSIERRVAETDTRLDKIERRDVLPDPADTSKVGAAIVAVGTAAVAAVELANKEADKDNK